MKVYKNLFVFLFGAVFSFLLVYFWNNINKKESAEVINKDYYIISNQLNKMNKMIVLEQNFSSFQTHKSSPYSIGGISIFPKEMVIYSTARAQVSYDLKKLKIDIDSINKKLIIKQIPSAEINIYPDVKIHFMDDNIINRFSKSDLNSILESAKKNMIKSIDQEKLKFEARDQMFSNLKDIFVLAKYLNYTIQDDTQQLKDIL